MNIIYFGFTTEHLHSIFYPKNTIKILTLTLILAAYVGNKLPNRLRFTAKKR